MTQFIGTRRALLRVHRWVSLAFATLWLLQALTGLFAVFHWEIEDATIPGAHHPTDFAAIERRAAALAPAGSGLRIASAWISAGALDRWDLGVERAGGADVASVRVDGAGTVLRRRAAGERIGDGGWTDSIVTFHQSLLAGDTGGWIVGTSGVLLLSNLAVGLALAWPRARQWRRALRPAAGLRHAPRWYGWHRALGLWVALPAMLTVAAGVLLVFEDGVEALLRLPSVSAPVEPPRGAPRVGLAQAVTIALRRHPGAAVSGIGFPSADDATWSVRLNQPGEAIRAYGKTRVAVSANDGRVTQDFDERAASAARRAFDHLFAFHTGEVAGLAGRIAVFALGLWLVTIVALGLALWWTRRRPVGRR